MNDFQNTPRTNFKRYEHQPLTIDHNGIHAKIQENGKVIITGLHDANDEYDEVEVPASLIFKLARLLRDTRVVDSSEK